MDANGIIAAYLPGGICRRQPAPGFEFGPPGVSRMERGSPPPTRLSPEAFKARVRGPILTVPTPFTRDFAVDYEGVRNMVKSGC